MSPTLRRRPPAIRSVKLWLGENDAPLTPPAVYPKVLACVAEVRACVTGVCIVTKTCSCSCRFHPQVPGHLPIQSPFSLSSHFSVLAHTVLRVVLSDHCCIPILQCPRDEIELHVRATFAPGPAQPPSLSPSVEVQDMQATSPTTGAAPNRRPPSKSVRDRPCRRGAHHGLIQNLEGAKVARSHVLHPAATSAHTRNLVSIDAHDVFHAHNSRPNSPDARKLMQPPFV